MQVLLCKASWLLLSSFPPLAASHPLLLVSDDQLFLPLFSSECKQLEVLTKLWPPSLQFLTLFLLLYSQIFGRVLLCCFVVSFFLF